MQNTTSIVRLPSISKPGVNRIPCPCGKCSATGFIAAYAGIYKGVCFDCNGTGVSSYRDYAYPTDWTDEAIAENEAKREKRRIAAAARKAAKDAVKNAATLAERDAYLASRPDVAALLPRLAEFEADDRSSFVAEVLRKATRGPLTESQAETLLAAVARFDARKVVLAERAAEEAAAEPFEEGRLLLEGKILSTKVVENGYGSTRKILVKLSNGSKVYGSVPKAIRDFDLGDLVRFTATVERSNDDPTFGFFRNPAKDATILLDAAGNAPVFETIEFDYDREPLRRRIGRIR